MSITYLDETEWTKYGRSSNWSNQFQDFVEFVGLKIHRADDNFTAGLLQYNGKLNVFFYLFSTIKDKAENSLKSYKSENSLKSYESENSLKSYKSDFSSWKKFALKKDLIVSR